MIQNDIVKDLQDTLTKCLFESGDLYVSKDIVNKAYNEVKNEIVSGFSVIDRACSMFAKSILKLKAESENESNGLHLIYSGELGGKLYAQKDPNKPLVTPNEDTLISDLNKLKASFNYDEYMQADEIHQRILSVGLISIYEYNEMDH